ncbi:MAG: dTMP kinase [Candidatus Babeliaceae bacterium]
MHILTRGFLITLEGIDGAGKSTIAHLLFEHLKKNYTTLLTKEPGATELGKQLRTILQTTAHALDKKAEFLLFAADRAEHIQKVIKSAYTNNTIIISDRMSDSSVAYQGYGRKLDLTIITTINSWIMEGLMPDITVYLKIDPHLAVKRIQKRGFLSSFDQEKIVFFEKVAAGFEDIFKKRTNVLYTDALLPETEIMKNIMPFIEEKLRNLEQ